MALFRRFVIDQAQATNASFGSPRALALAGLTVRMDSSWSPYVQASISAGLPSAADLTAIDPRNGWRAGARIRSFDGAGALIATFSTSLGIRSRTRGYRRGPGASFNLELGGDEALLQDYPFGYGTGSGGVTRNASAWANDAAVAAGMTLTVVVGAPDPTMGSADTGWQPDQSAWDYINTIAEAAGARVWVAEWGQLLWSSPTYVADTVTRSIDGIIDVDDTISRDAPDWANFAVVNYQASGTYVTSDGGQSPRKGLLLTRKGRQPAGNGATKVRQAAQNRGRNLLITHVADLAMRPLQKRTATYQGVSWTGTVQSIAWAVPGGTQTTVLNVIE